MANTIRIKRRSTDSTAPTTSQVVNGELAFNENNDILYYGEGGNSSASTTVLKIGGPGAFLTTDTTQTPSGKKIFSTSTLEITGAGSSGQVLSASGTGGALTWTTSNAYSTVTGNSGTTTATGAASLSITGTAPISVAVTSNTATISASAASTSAAGVVQLSDSTSTSSSTLAATSTAVKSAYDLASAALPKSGGTMTGAISLHADPSSALHAATKQYVDSVAQGLHVHATADAATTAKLSTLAGVAVSYSSGTQAITWTGGTAATTAGFTDGVTLTSNTTEASASKLLVKNEGDVSGLGAQYNGTYYVYGARELRRTSDGNTAADFAGGDFCYVVSGTLYEATGWVQTEKVVTLDTTPIIWQQFSGAGTVTAGNGLSSTGTTINVGTADTSRIVVNADTIDLATVTYTSNAGSAGINFVQSVAVDNYGRITGTTAANVRTGSISQTGILQLTDSTTSTSTTTAATPAAVKSAYDLATAALPKAGGTMTGKITTVTTSSSTANILLAGASTDPSAPASGDVWNNNGTIKFYNGSATKTFAFTDSNITGTAANVTGTVAVSNGGTGAVTLTGILKGNGTSAFTAASAGTDYVVGGTTTVGKIITAASTTAAAGFLLTSGVAPTAPATGDLWNASGSIQFRFDGSTTKTIAFTDSNITGSAATLTTARTIQTNLGSTSSASFDGSTNITPGVTGTLPVANGGTGITSFGAGVATWLGNPTSANLRTAVTDETGTGSLVFATAPTVTLPQINNVIDGFTSTATAGGVTTLTVDSNYRQFFTGTANHTVRLPVVSTLTNGQAYEIHNNSTGEISVHSSGSNLLVTIPGGQSVLCTCVNTLGGTGIGSWDADVCGGVIKIDSSSVTGILPVPNGGTGATTFTTNGILYGNGTSSINVTAQGTWDSTNSSGQLLTVNSSNVPTWTNTIDGGGY